MVFLVSLFCDPQSGSKFPFEKHIFEKFDLKPFYLPGLSLGWVILNWPALTLFFFLYFVTLKYMSSKQTSGKYVTGWRYIVYIAWAKKYLVYFFISIVRENFGLAFTSVSEITFYRFRTFFFLNLKASKIIWGSQDLKLQRKKNKKIRWATWNSYPKSILFVVCREEIN